MKTKSEKQILKKSIYQIN